MTKQEIFAQFGLSDAVEILPFGEGHINDTFLVTAADGKQYVLQRINHVVFPHPEEVMENIFAVTHHIRKKITAEGGDPTRQTLHYRKTKDGALCYFDGEGYFRVYDFIGHAKTYQTVESPELLRDAAMAFGLFQKRLADFPADKLHEVIPNFHHTPTRFAAFQEAVRQDVCGRAKDVQTEIAFALAREADTHVVTDAIRDGLVPLRVTHNDTKLNNILFDETSGKACCVIDLDTVMPGSLLYDYGDALRFGASSAAEDEPDLRKVFFRLDCFSAYTEGFLSSMGDTLTKKEKELLPHSVKLLTFECGIRFLTDYLNGDTYFKIHRPNHNLDRCRTQFALVADMERKMAQMEQIRDNA